jgi:hypothetical protein
VAIGQWKAADRAHSVGEVLRQVAPHPPRSLALAVSALRKTVQCSLVPCSVRLSLGRTRRTLKSQALGRRAGGFQRCSVVVAGAVSLKSDVALTRRLELGTGRVGGFERRRVVVAGGVLWRSNTALEVEAGVWGRKSWRFSALPRCRGWWGVFEVEGRIGGGGWSLGRKELAVLSIVA